VENYWQGYRHFIPGSGISSGRSIASGGEWLLLTPLGGDATTVAGSSARNGTGDRVLTNRQVVLLRRLASLVLAMVAVVADCGRSGSPKDMSSSA